MFLDLSHPLEDGMPCYPGLPRPKIASHFDHAGSRSRYQGQAEFYVNHVDMVGNTGTYLDAPFHRHPRGPDLSELPLDRVAGVSGLLVDASSSPERALSLPAEPREIAGRAVLFRTDWDTRWGSDWYWEPGPYLSGQAVDLLVASAPAVVGVDFWNVDDTTDLSRPAHTRLLAAGIPIVEHLTRLGALPRTGFRFFAVPLPLVRGASFSVRAFAEVP
jgi:kynurenine formamidase